MTWDLLIRELRESKEGDLQEAFSNKEMEAGNPKRRPAENETETIEIGEIDRC